MTEDDFETSHQHVPRALHILYPYWKIITYKELKILKSKCK